MFTYQEGLYIHLHYILIDFIIHRFPNLKYFILNLPNYQSQCHILHACLYNGGVSHYRAQHIKTQTCNSLAKQRTRLLRLFQLLNAC